MQSSHWWLRWDTPISPKNPFRSELEALGSFFVRSEVGDFTLAVSGRVHRLTESSPSPSQIRVRVKLTESSVSGL